MDSITTISLVAGAVGTAMAIFERIRNSKLSALHETASTWKEDRDAWKARFETEHDEYKDYREKSHEAVKDIQAKIFQLTSENSELRIKTDITPLLQSTEEQRTINQKILQSLELIVVELTRRER